MSNKITYRRQFTRCGKQRCRKCKEGEGHGPYWYSYWSENGRTVSKYIGTQLPPEIEALQASNQEEPSSSDTASTPVDAALPVVPVISSTSPVASPLLRVYLLGQFRVERRVGDEWTPIDNRIWRRRRARALLGCLLNSNGRRLGREQIIEQLWPDRDIDVATNRLNGAVHELRQILEPELARPAASRMLRLERDVLVLADSTAIWVDVDAFDSLLKAANTLTNATQIEPLLEEAAALYGGHYLLEELYSEWTIQRRDALQRSWIGLLLQLADIRAERGAYTSAIETLDRIRAADPTNETALQRLMVLLTQLDRRGEALQVYRQHTTLLERDYESEPLPETRTLYEMLRQGYLPTPHIHKTPTPTQREQESVSLSPTSNGEETISLPLPTFQLSRHNQSPLVGRSRERTIMQQALLAIEKIPHDAPTPPKEQVQGEYTPTPKQPHLLLLQGEPGIGKTRLAEEMSMEAYTRGWAVAWSRVYEQEGAIPYRLWIELFRTLLKEILPFVESTSEQQSTLLQSLQTKLERLKPLLLDLDYQPSSLPPRPALAALSQEQDRLHLWEAALGLLTLLSNTYPLLLILDDIHWADESSIELLTYLAHHLHNQRILLIATCRDEELPPQHKLRMLISDLQREQTIVTLPIQPLTHAQIEALVSHLAPEIVHSIQTQASGNPFFAEELARFVGNNVPNSTPTGTEEHQQDPLQRTLGSDTLRIPDPILSLKGRSDTRKQRSVPEGIAAVLERRLAHLSSECQALLAKAAVLGGSFELEQLLAMTGEQSEDKTLDLLEEALFAGILTEEGTGAHISYHFWHPLIVSHLYERLSAARRAQLHRRAAEAIKHLHAASQLEKVAATIVYHLNKGGGDSASIAHYAELAGNNAYTLAAYAEAQHYYLQAYYAFIGKEPYTMHEIDIRTTIQQSIEHMTLHLQRATTDIQLLLLCRLLERISECLVVQGSFDDARRLYEHILAIRTSPLFQRMYVPHGQAQLHEAQIQALLWREIGNIWVGTGEYANAYACYEQGKEIMSNAGVTTGAAWACLHLQYGAMLRLDGNYQEARRYLQEALTMLEHEMPHMTHTAYTNAEQGIAQSSTQQATSSQPPMSKALQTRTERALTGNALEIGYVHEQLGIVDACVGQLSDGLRHMHIARVMYEQHELFTDIVRICGNLGAAYIMRSELSEARTYLHRSYDLAERIGDLPNKTFLTCNLGDVASRSGDLLEAETWFKRGLVFAEQINDREHISWSSVELAMVQQDLGRLDEAATHLKHAISIGRAMKSKRCIRYALVGLGDIRITEAIIACTRQPTGQPHDDSRHNHICQRLLNRAKSTLQRAIALEDEGLQVEPIIHGKLLLAMAYFLQDDLETAYTIARQTLAEAQKHETSRVLGRAQRLLGRILCAQGQHTEADHYFEQAVHLFRKHALRLDYARTLYGYGAALIQRLPSPDKPSAHVVQQEGSESDYQRGLRYLQEARNIFAACHATIDLAWVEQLLTNEGETTHGRHAYRWNSSTATTRETATDRTSH